MSNNQRSRRRRRKKKKSNILGKILPAIIAIVLIIVIAIVSFGKQILDKYSYSKEKYDMTVYFENKSESDVAIIMQNDFMEERAYLYSGTYYVDLDFVHTYLNDRFYYDEVDELLVYAMPTDLLTTSIGSTVLNSQEGPNDFGYIITRKEGDKILLALDYLKGYANFEYQAFTDPNRIQMYTTWEDRKVAKVKKANAVRHRGGVKSEILKEVEAGEELIIVEEMETWSKVKTNDAIIGFIENKRLGDIYPEMPLKVTDYEEPEYTNLCKEYKINMGWHAVASAAGNDTLESYVSKTKGLNVISPTWFRLNDSNGNYDNLATQDYISKAHSMGLEVWPTLDNNEHYDDVDMKQVLCSTSRRQDLIKRLMNDVLAMGIDGINVDIEMLPLAAGKDFSEFIRELSIECRRNGIVLSVDNYVPIGNTGYYDRKTQGEVADYVVIMGYDEHYGGSQETGSVASIGYVQMGIENTLSEVPAFKVINGIPFYTRVWETEGSSVSSRAMGMADANEWVANHSVKLEWDDETCQYYGEKTEGSTFYQIWMEDAESIKVKLNVMKSFNIGGVAEWRLDFETKDVWDVIEEYVNQ